jgi:hypothetical protein
MDANRWAGVAVIGAIAALLPSAAAVPARDLRSPDTRDAAARAARVYDVMPWQDLRTPDAQDAAFDVEHAGG